MKLSGIKADTYLSSKTETSPLTILFGADEAKNRNLVSQKAKHILGENAHSEMRLSHLESKDVAREPALMFDAVKTVSFFPGPTGIIIYGCTDGLSEHLAVVLDSWQENDAIIFAQAGNLTKASKLRKIFEPHPKAQVIGIYPEKITSDKINQLIKQFNLSLSKEAHGALLELGLQYEEDAFRSLLDGIALYQGKQETPLSFDQIEKIIPTGYASAIDDIISHILNGESKNLVLNLRRAPAQGVSLHQIVTIFIRRLYDLVKVKSAQDPSFAMKGIYPQLFGERRDKFERTLREWPLSKLETALQLANDTEKTLRSGAIGIPEHALVERNLLRVCFLSR